MNRRNFLSLFSAGIAGIALEQAIPLGRVWSFPKTLIIPPKTLIIPPNNFLPTEWITAESLRMLKVRFPALYIQRGPIWFDKTYCGLPPG